MFIDRSNVRFMGRSVEFIKSVHLLGVPLYADLKVNHIHRNVQKFNCKVNSVLFDFKDIQIGYEPADLTVHHSLPPKKISRVGSFFPFR